MYLRGNSIGTDGRRRRRPSPRHDYVLTRMVLLYKYNVVLYFMVRNDTLKKGGNAPRATDEKRFLSSASPY
jgi:hypothetical protein